MVISRIALALGLAASVSAAENVLLVGVPDYAWWAGCFGTASGNLVGYWDRHGFSRFYEGPTAGGFAPLNNGGLNRGIRSIWASQANLDGRPALPGHIEDYWDFYFENGNSSYESASVDPYVRLARPEHQPDCTGDFMGASQNKYSDLDGECSGNIDAFAFNFWDKTGNKRVNFEPGVRNGQPIRDIQSGLRKWANWRGSEAEVFSQLADFNPHTPFGKGFTFQDLKAEIDAGYPVMLFLQDHDQFSRAVTGNPRANPSVHAMVAHGYITTDWGQNFVRYKTSWGSSGDNTFTEWGPDIWQANLPLRGVIGFRPKPKIRSVNYEQSSGLVQVRWEAPQSVLYDDIAGTITELHWYILEGAPSVDGPFIPLIDPTTGLESSVQSSEAIQFFRVKQVERPQ